MNKAILFLILVFTSALTHAATYTLDERQKNINDLRIFCPNDFFIDTQSNVATQILKIYFPSTQTEAFQAVRLIESTNASGSQGRSLTRSYIVALKRTNQHPYGLHYSIMIRQHFGKDENDVVALDIYQSLLNYRTTDLLEGLCENAVYVKKP